MSDCQKNSRCESCGMPLKKDPNGLGGGTEKDGTISKKYCSLCYSNWELHYTGTDVTEFQDRVEEAMKQAGHWRLMRKFVRLSIPSLPRWKKK